jgi:hypothetical protein
MRISITKPLNKERFMQYFTGNFGKLGTLFLVLLLTLLMAASASAMPGNGNGGGGGGGNAGGGSKDPDPKYLAEWDLLILDVDQAGEVIPAESTSLNFDDIIFRDTEVDLNGFGVSDPENPNNICSGFGQTPGTLVLGPSNEVADLAKLTFWFKGQLSSDDGNNGKVVQYLLSMEEGSMSTEDEDENPLAEVEWPPSGTNVTFLTYSSWKISAENKKSQRSDCQGGTDLDVIIGVTLKP